MLKLVVITNIILNILVNNTRFKQKKEDYSLIAASSFLNIDYLD
jgi:hypothetical protein